MARLLVIIGLAGVGLVAGMALAASRVVDPLDAVQTRMAAAAPLSATASGSWQPWAERLTAMDPADPQLPAVIAQAIDAAPTAEALAQTYQIALAAPWSEPRREAWRILTADHLRVLGNPGLAADVEIRQAEQALALEHSATTAVILRERADLDLMSATTAWTPARRENRRRLAALHIWLKSPADGLDVLIPSVFAADPAAEPIYRGTIATSGLPVERIRSEAQLDELPLLITDSGFLAKPIAPFRLLAAAYAADRIGASQPLWERRGAHLALGATAALVAAGDMDGIAPERAALERIAALRRSGIHATDAVKVTVWTWAVR